MLGVSRPTIREALVRLETNRRISREPKSAFRVKQLTAQESLVLDRIVVSLLAIALETLRFPLSPETHAELERLATRCAQPEAATPEQDVAAYCAAVIGASVVPIISGMYQDRVILPSIGQERRGVSDADRAFVAQLHQALAAEDLAAAMTIVERAREELRQELLRDLELSREEPVAEAIAPGEPKHGQHPRQAIMADEVTRAIRDLIVSGEFPPGAELHDQELTERFGTSRTPVREALNLLEAERLVVVRPQSGTTVAPISIRAVQDSIRMLATTTAFVVRESIGLLTEDDLAVLREVVAEDRETLLAAPGPADRSVVLTGFSEVFFARYRSLSLVGLRDRALPQLLRIMAVDETLARRALAERRRVLGPLLAQIQAGDGEGAAARIEAYGQRLIDALLDETEATERGSHADSSPR